MVTSLMQVVSLVGMMLVY